jgi:hypothetical protein
VIDPGQQAIKINEGSGGYPDDGEVACSLLSLSDDGRDYVTSQVSSGSRCYTGGVDAHEARGWSVRDNWIEGFWCGGAGERYLSEHGIHFWDGSRDTVVERNTLVDNARGIGFGMSSGGRQYADAPCGGLSADHYGGIIRNNAIVATRPELLSSGNGVDGGIQLWYACEVGVYHNSFASKSAPFHAIEYRFATTSADIANNLLSHDLAARDGGTARLSANREDVPLSLFQDVDAADLHLVPGASAIDAGDPAVRSRCDEDIDGEPRDSAPDQGMDER